MEKSEPKVIPMITTGLFCFAVGAASGIAWMTSAGYKARIPSSESPSAIVNPAMANPKHHLAALVVKLDQLTGKPLALELNDEDRAKILELLEGVEDSVTHNEVAADRLGRILEIVEDDRATLHAAGYRWPGTPLFRPGMEPEPFMSPRNLNALNSLRAKLAAVKPTIEPIEE